jgi:serine phosphatase RsbU (regulator of sigma subunit)
MFNKLINYFIPPVYKINEEVHGKAKISVGAFLVVAYFNINYIIISTLIEYPGGLYSQVPLFFISVICLFLFKKLVNPNVVHTIFFIFCIISIAITICFTKGYDSFITPWIASTPIVALLISGKRGGILSLIACSCVLTALYCLYLNGYEFPEDFNLKYKNVFKFSTNLGLIFILYLIAIVFDNSKNTAFKNLDIKNKELDEQKKNLEIKQKEILDSINYAKKIQEAILPSDKQVALLLPQSFVLYKPKDIVSGDFYWATQWANKILFAAVDCTGHGVPGAFMSIVGQNLLNQAVNEQGLTTPNLILNSLNKGISRTLNQNKDIAEIKDGMDISLCCWDIKEMMLEFAGAYNPLWILRQGEFIIIEGDKFPVGSFVDDRHQNFKNNEILLQKGDIIYIFTDGYSDQFGGPNGKKFKQKQIKKILLEIQQEPMLKQRELLNTCIEDWKGGKEDQLDDILFMGIKV